MVVRVCVLASQEAGLSTSIRGRVTGKVKGLAEVVVWWWVSWMNGVYAGL